MAPFALELFNGPHRRRGTDTEAVGVEQAAPELGWRVWTAADDVCPHAVLLAAEAVHAAQAQSLEAGEALDLGLPRLLDAVAQHRPPRRDPRDRRRGAKRRHLPRRQALAGALDDGRHRSDVTADYAVAQTAVIPGSPTFRLPDGTTLNKPGTQSSGRGRGQRAIR